jgi:hypothetical protein
MKCIKILDAWSTSVHSPQHRSNEAIDPPAFLNERNEGRNAAFVIGRIPEVREDDTLERFNLVLKTHQV